MKAVALLVLTLVAVAGCQGPEARQVQPTNSFALAPSQTGFLAGWASECWACPKEADPFFVEESQGLRQMRSEGKLRQLRKDLHLARRTFARENRIIRTSEQLQREKLRDVRAREEF